MVLSPPQLLPIALISGDHSPAATASPWLCLLGLTQPVGFPISWSHKLTRHTDSPFNDARKYLPYHALQLIWPNSPVSQGNTISRELTRLIHFASNYIAPFSSAFMINSISDLLGQGEAKTAHDFDP